MREEQKYSGMAGKCTIFYLQTLFTLKHIQLER